MPAAVTLPTPAVVRRSAAIASSLTTRETPSVSLAIRSAICF